MFNIASTKYNLAERSLEIYVSGCKGQNGVHCKDCHNPVLWDENHGKPWVEYKDYIRKTVEDSGNLIKSIRIYGGEPLEKDEQDIVDLLVFLKEQEKELWLFTRFLLPEVPSRVLRLLDYVKCGPYLPEMKRFHEEYGVVLATYNQHIYKRGEDYV